ncbi:MAG: type II and III secretion system protein family protein [Parvularculaceae bacterium]|nr:type II and III secretion system protein family protein [Parvularculaceae bacterium]
MLNAGARFFVALCATAALGLAAPAAAQKSAKIDFGGDGAASKSIVLPLNKAAIVELPQPAADVLVSQPTIVDAVIRSPQRVYLLGLQVGQANAFFFDANGRQILNLEIQVERDVDALTDLIARLMPDARISAEAINDNVVLKGTVPSGVQATDAADIAARFVGDPKKVISMVSIRDREQVMLKVRVVEMQRSLIKQLGLDPSGVASLSNSTLEAAASTIASGATACLSGTFTRFFGSSDQSNVSLSFQALERVGLVKTLAEPTLTAVSGETASFLAGGEFPIPVGQNDGVISLEFKEFGVGLGFTPLVLDKGRINVKVSTEVSEISSLNNFSLSGSTATIPGVPDELIPIDTDGDGIPDDVFNVTQTAGVENPPTVFTTSGLTVPSLTVRRAKTTVELPSGGSLVMAGLLQENMRQTVQGIPYLKDIAVLGQLFRSRDYANSETELVIIVTPYLVDPTHESKLTDPLKGFVAASDMQTILLGDLVATYGLSGAGVEEKTLQGPMGFILD